PSGDFFRRATFRVWTEITRIITDRVSVSCFDCKLFNRWQDRFQKGCHLLQIADLLSAAWCVFWLQIQSLFNPWIELSFKCHRHTPSQVRFPRGVSSQSSRSSRCIEKDLVFLQPDFMEPFFIVDNLSRALFFL